MPNVLMTESLTFSYDQSITFNFPNITCRAGQHSLIMGPSGCGKTTLLHLIAGLLKPSSGNILINDKNISDLGNSQIDRIRGKEIGIIFQKSHFIQALNVYENLLMPSYLNDLKEDSDKINRLLDSLNILNKRNAKPKELSQGEQQRLSIARAIINKPRLILADEPTSSLDDKNCEEVISLLKSQAESAEASLLIVTHDKRLLESFSHIINL